MHIRTHTFDVHRSIALNTQPALKAVKLSITIPLQRHVLQPHLRTVSCHEELLIRSVDCPSDLISVYGGGEVYVKSIQPHIAIIHFQYVCLCKEETLVGEEGTEGGMRRVQRYIGRYSSAVALHACWYRIVTAAC